MVSVTASLPASLDGMVANVRQLCPHERIEFFEKLLRDCSIMEIRFIASLVENIMSANYGSLGSVEDELPLLLANSEKLQNIGDKLNVDDQRRQLIVILCLLKSRERMEVTKQLAEILQRLPEAVRKMNASSSLTVLAAHEILLLFSLAMCHPAFEFSQKYNFYTALQSVVDLLQPALGDGDKESCILLKSSFNDLVASSSSAPVSSDRIEPKCFKISQDEDIAFIQVDIPATSSPNGTHSSLKSVTVKTEKLVNVFAEKCVQHPSNPKTDPNNVLLKSKDGTRESVLHSALNAIVSDGGVTKLLEIFPQDAKIQMAEERIRRTAVKQDSLEVGNSCSPESDFAINENHSPDNSSAQSGLTSGSSASSLRGFDKKMATDLSRSSNMSSGVGSASNLDSSRDSRKLAPSAPPSLSVDEHSTSTVNWNNSNAPIKNGPEKVSRSEDNAFVESTFSKLSLNNGGQPAECYSNGDHGALPNKLGGRLHPVEFFPFHPSTDPKSLSMYLQYAQAYQTAAMLGMHPPPGSHLMWPNPHMIDPTHPPHSPFVMPFPMPLHQQQQLQLEHHNLMSNANNNSRVLSATASNSRTNSQGASIQASTPSPVIHSANSKQDNSISNTNECDKVSVIAGNVEVLSNGAMNLPNSVAPASSATPPADSSVANSTLTETNKALKDDTVALVENSESSSLSGSSTSVNGVAGIIPTSGSSNTASLGTQPRAIPPFGQMHHPPLHLGATGPLSLPNFFTVPFVPYAGQAPPTNQSSATGSRRGSITSESGSISGDQPHLPAYFLYPPVAAAHLAAAHSASVGASSNGAPFIAPRNGLPPFNNPPPPLPGAFNSSASNASVSSRKNSVSIPAQVNIHAVSPAQLFSIPPPPLPMAAAQKNGNSSSSGNGPAQASVPHGVSGGPVPVPLFALSNRGAELHHAIAFPTFMSASHVDSYSPPPQGPPSPSHSTNAAANTTNNLQGSLARSNGEVIRNHGPFSGHVGHVGNRRAPITSFANIHYHQRLNGQSSHLHQSQSTGNMPSYRPQPTAVRGNTVNCFRCGEPGHLQNQCTNNSRRKTPYMGRDFQINPVPLANSASSNPENQPDLRSLHFANFIQRSVAFPQTTSTITAPPSGTSTAESTKPVTTLTTSSAVQATLPSTSSSKPLAMPSGEVDSILPAVVVTSESPTCPAMAIAQ